MEERMNYLYKDAETEELFYVQADNRYEADIIAKENFEAPEFIRVDSDLFAEMYGYDTY